MSRLRTAIRSYPLVAVTLLVGAVGLLLLATPARPAAAWIVGAYAIGVAVWQGFGMIRQLVRGHAGLDILAVTAITAAASRGPRSWWC